MNEQAGSRRGGEGAPVPGRRQSQPRGTTGACLPRGPGPAPSTRSCGQAGWTPPPPTHPPTLRPVPTFRSASAFWLSS